MRVVIYTARLLGQLEIFFRNRLCLKKVAQTLQLIDILEYSFVGVWHKGVQRWISDVFEFAMRIGHRIVRTCEDIFLPAILALDATYDARAALQIPGILCSFLVRNEILILAEEAGWAITEVVDVQAYCSEAFGAREEYVHQRFPHMRHTANDFAKH